MALKLALASSGCWHAAAASLASLVESFAFIKASMVAHNDLALAFDIACVAVNTAEPLALHILEAYHPFKDTLAELLLVGKNHIGFEAFSIFRTTFLKTNSK